MSKVKDLFYDIETLYIDGVSAANIAKELACPVEYVKGVLDGFGVQDVADSPQDEEVYSPYYG
jgi:hypothetical protein